MSPIDEGTETELEYLTRLRLSVAWSIEHNLLMHEHRYRARLLYVERRRLRRAVSTTGISRQRILRKMRQLDLEDPFEAALEIINDKFLEPDPD